jgi:cellulase
MQWTSGPEFYPQCLNFKVTGSGTKTLPTGTAAKSLYRGDEPGLTIKNLHTTAEHADYIIPGPALWTGA